MIQRLFLAAGWAALAFIAYATLSPLDDRPVIAGPQFEHFAAFALMGFAFALGYKRTLLAHGRVVDALVKAAGGISGIGVAHLGLFLSARIIRAEVSSGPE